MHWEDVYKVYQDDYKLSANELGIPKVSFMQRFIYFDKIETRNYTSHFLVTLIRK